MNLIAPVIDDLLAHFQKSVGDIPLDEPTGWAIVGLIGLAVIVGPWILLLGMRQLRQGYRIFANDPVGAGEVHLEDGIVEVEGVTTPLSETLSGKYTGKPAVAHSWRRERKEERTDSDGNTETSWKTVSQGSRAVPFLVKDETGEVAVDPSGANLSINKSQVRQSGLVRGRNQSYREYEGRIEPGDSVHVYGQKRSASEGDETLGDERTYIGDGHEVSEFVVSDGSELRTVLRYLGQGIFLVVVGVLWIPSATFFFLALLEEVLGIPVASWLVALLG